MNKGFRLLGAFFAVAQLVAIPAGAQTALTSTTLSAAVTDTKSTFIVVASATGFTAGSTKALVDNELMDVRAVNGTLITVVRGVSGTKTAKHPSGATVYVAAVGAYIISDKYGSCTRSAELYLPQINVTNFRLNDCFNSKWQQYDLEERYDLDVAPQAQPSAASPTVGRGPTINGQQGGAQSATTSDGAAGGAIAMTAGAGGAGGSSSGTGGAGGAVTILGGAGAGTVTGGGGGGATLGGGAGGNGSGAGGTGGGLTLYSGAAGTGGTGTVGAITIKSGGASGTEVFGTSTAGKTTVASSGTNQDLALDASGTGNVTTADGVRSSSASKGIGYATGAGCAVVQGTNKGTGVTCAGVSGSITTHGAELATATSIAFTVTNTSVAATDVIVVSIKSGATAASYTVTVDAVAAGSFNIHLRNVSGGNLSEAIVINFAVIKAVAA